MHFLTTISCLVLTTTALSLAAPSTLATITTVFSLAARETPPPPPPDDGSQRPLPPTAGDDPRFTFTATVTLVQPTGIPEPNVYYVFTGQPELTGFHNEKSVGVSNYTGMAKEKRS
jgi:hypothetical protein